MISVKVSTDNLKRFGEAAAGVKDFTRPNREIAIELYRWMLRNYDSGGSLVGGWTPLSPRTAAYKAKRGWSTVPLAPRTGRLRMGFSYSSNNERAVAFNPVPYSAYHDKGAPSRNLPRRQLLPNAENVEKYAARIYQAHVDKHLKGKS
jgi:phage gpG-like protein